MTVVSIHALLAECDPGCGFCIICIMRFNPRTPCGVRPLRRHRLFRRRCFNPRTPCGVRPKTTKTERKTLCFNPRTPCGVRLFAKHTDCPCMLFQSTHSFRSATQSLGNSHQPERVSIHALLAECDITSRKLSQSATVSIHALLAECDPTSGNKPPHNNSFNPRTPCGVRLVREGAWCAPMMFQSTHSLRSAT